MGKSGTRSGALQLRYIPDMRSGRTENVLPQDYVACCSADIRRTQSKIRGLRTLMGLWENSVRLNVASAILRQALITSVNSSLQANAQSPPSIFRLDLPDIPPIEEFLSPDVVGLRSSIEGAFGGTLQYLLAFPVEDLRRVPDPTLLLGPNAALFLCLLLCFPCNGILGPAFQKTAIGLIQDIARHVGQAVHSPQDTVSLHSAYLDSVVNLLRLLHAGCISFGLYAYEKTPDTVPSSYDDWMLRTVA